MPTRRKKFCVACAAFSNSWQEKSHRKRQHRRDEFPVSSFEGSTRNWKPDTRNSPSGYNHQSQLFRSNQRRNLFPMTMRVRKAVFPAAGLGTRFLPVTKAQPKEMLPLVDKPIIQYGVEEAHAAGCYRIIMITGRGKQAIEDHFDVSYELEKMLEERKKFDLLQIVRQISDMIHVAYVRQKEALGLGHAVLTARELVGDEPFAVLLADDVIDAKVPCLRQLMNVFEEKQCSVIATKVVECAAISPYGVLKAKEVAGAGGRLYEIED